MYNETTLTVNVDATSKRLSDTAVNMWIANEVVLELDQPDAPDVESGKSFYAQMTKKVLSDGAQGVTDGYYFTFDTGDVFFSATANGYPELVGDTLNIGTDNGGGGGGSPLIVRCTVSNDEYVLSEDWDTINEAFTEDGRSVLIEFTDDDDYCLVTEVQSVENSSSESRSGVVTKYVVVCTNLFFVDFNYKYIFSSSTSSGTLSCNEPLPIGGTGGVLVVHGTITHNADQSTDYTVDKTWQEIHDADTAVLKFELHNGSLNAFILNDLIATATFIEDGDNDSYGVMFSSPDAVSKFCSSMLTTDSANGYPSHHEAVHY